MAHQNYGLSLTDEESDEQSDGKSSGETLHRSLDGSTYPASRNNLIGQGFYGSSSKGANYSFPSDEESDEQVDNRSHLYIAPEKVSAPKMVYLEQRNYPSPNKLLRISQALIEEESDEQPDHNSGRPNKRLKSTDWDSDEYASVPKKRTLSGRSDSTGSSNFDEASPAGGDSTSMKFLPMGSMRDPFNTESQDNQEISSKALSMMKKMGYKEGSGLGKFEQGRRTIVEASSQIGRRGLGLSLDGLEPEEVLWDFSQEQVEVEEEIFWIPSGANENIPQLDRLHSWIREGPKKETIEDETQFCDPDILSQILSAKSIFDKLESTQMRRAVARSNPFESIKGGIFQNRAAMKMANLDYVFNYMFTNPIDEHGNSMLDPMGLLYFADVCAGPGGFSEYVLWKKRWEAKGFGFTLKASNDFKLDAFLVGSPETFEPHYGKDGTGNIFIPENLTCFRDYILSHTDNLGVHFMMADGGFSVEGQENIQEVLSKQLYLCQFLCALYIVRVGGHFVCKLFDVFTPFSVGLIYLMYLSFKQISIHKPNTSRPANSERYLVCKWKREDIVNIIDYLYYINLQLNQNSDEDVRQLVDPHVIQGNEDFFNYIVDSNNRIGTRQIMYLDKVRYFAKNKNLNEVRQPDMKRKSLAIWKVPDRVRAAPPKPEPEMKFIELVKPPSSIPFGSDPRPLTRSDLHYFHGVYDYHCVVVSDGSHHFSSSSSHFFFLLGLGRNHVYTRATARQRWTKVSDKFILELPAGTLLYAECVRELMGEGLGQKNIPAVHIIDALFLGERDIRNLPYYDRMAQAKRLVKAVSKPTNPKLCPIRVKEVFPLNDIEKILKRLSLKQAKNANSNVPVRLGYTIDGTRHFFPSGVLIFKVVIAPWMIGFSKREKKFYFYNTIKKESRFEPANGIVASFSDSFAERFFWSWEDGILNEGSIPEDPTKVHRSHLLATVASLRANLR